MLKAFSAFVFVVCIQAGCEVERSPKSPDTLEREAGGGDAAGDTVNGGCATEPGDGAGLEAGQDGAVDGGAGDSGVGDEATGADSSAPDSEATFCGNQVVETGEQCDDGMNGDPDDGCRDDCIFSCRDPAADCVDVAGDCRRLVCVVVPLGAVCEMKSDESDVRDDGNLCTYDFCYGSEPGHENRSDGYSCENGEGLQGDYCRQGSCIDPSCGDGVRGPQEQCDDGANFPGDGCSPECILEACGDGELNSGEDCDDGVDGDAEDGCDDDCHFTCFIPELDCPADAAGDCLVPACKANSVGQVCSQQADSADPAIDGNPCTEDLCNPGPKNPSVDDGTACDNQAGKVGDYCYLGYCIDPVCGDKVVGPREGCDDGNSDPCDGCVPNCKLRGQYCGDGYLCEPEQCDDGNIDSGDGCSALCQAESAHCPPEMVEVPADTVLGANDSFCMDRYEASRPDATFTSMGLDASKAVSRPNVIPWSSNPMSATVLAAYQAACAAAGKYLCGKEQWYAACTGPDRTSYAFGNAFNPEICNCVATFCDDYCADHGIDLASCNTTISSCGYDCGLKSPQSNVECMRVEPTGQYPGCTSAFGAKDVAGNLWEVVPSAQDSRGYEVRGGAFNCAAPADRLQCAFNATWNVLNAGFRCCLDIK